MKIAVPVNANKSFSVNLANAYFGIGYALKCLGCSDTHDGSRM